MTAKAVQLLLYRWAGQWGPFKVNIPCGECSLTADVIQGHAGHRARRHSGRGGDERVADRVVEASPQGGVARADRDGGRQGREPGPRAQPRRAHRGGDRRARGAYRGIRQPSLRQGDLPPLRAGERLLRHHRHRLCVPRRGQGPARALRDARPGEAHRRPEDPDHRAADLDRRKVHGRGRRVRPLPGPEGRAQPRTRSRTR